MESLYTKYRPQTFADVVGQTHVVTTLERAVMEGRTSHAYLFCGPRGTGKTTMARLLAKALMCEQGEGHLPDGTCEQCRLIAAGEHPDVYELDAASRTGVDNVRDEIISRVSFAPVRAPDKMYIIDEVHMLTTAAFNALLKTIEEPPAHVVFVLCTTDPQKIPETILSRVQRFDFHAIGNADIQARLAYICEREGFGYDPEALELVVRHARGGMRDAISELEQLSVSGGGTISVDVARDVLGEVPASTLERMSMAMAKRDVPTLFAQVEGLVEVGRDLLLFTRALAGRLRDVYVVAAIGATSGTVMASDDELPAISREAQAFGSVDRVARALELLSDASIEMRVAPNQRLVLEVALTKIARPQSELTLEALADRVASLERQVVALAQPGARAAAAAPAATREPARQAPAEVPTARQQKPAPHVRQEAPAPAPQQAAPAQPSRAAEPPQPRAAAPVQKPQRQEAAAPVERPSVQQAQPAAQQQPARPAPAQAAPAAPATPVVDKGELQRKWKQVVDGLLSKHPQHGSLLMNSTAASDDGQTLLVSLPKGSGFACKMLDRADVRANVDPMIASVFGHRKTQFSEGGARSAKGASQRPAYAPASSSQASASQSAAATHQAPRSAAAPQSQTPSASQQVPKPNPLSHADAKPQAPAASQHQSAAVQQPRPQQAAPAAQQSWQQAAPAQQQAWQQQVAPAQHSQPQQPASAQRPQPQQPALAAQQTSSYAAPWEPASLGDDVVPYDDYDAAPYEEDYAFGEMDPQRAITSRAASAPVSQPVMTPESQQVQAPVQKPVQAPAAQQEWPSNPQATAAPQGAPAPAFESQPATVPEPQPVREPAQESQPVPAPAPEPQPEQASAPVAESKPAAAPAPKRTRRRATGIPADIVSMMTEIFGEGVTYTAEVQDDEEDLSSELEAADDEPAESEFVEEVVDDADYEEEE